MKYVDEYRKRGTAEKLIAHIKTACTREVRLMEVCGTHTVAIFRSGIRGMLPANKQEAFPYVLPLVLILFPLNSHFAIYGTYTSSLIWFLVGLAAAAWRGEAARSMQNKG